MNKYAMLDSRSMGGQILIMCDGECFASFNDLDKAKIALESLRGYNNDSELMPKVEKQMLEIQINKGNHFNVDCPEHPCISEIYDDCVVVAEDNEVVAMSNKSLYGTTIASLEHRRDKDFESRYSMHYSDGCWAVMLGGYVGRI